MINEMNEDEWCMSLASLWGLRSKAVRKKVGCILYKDKTIISDGYNGLPAGEEPDVCEYVDENGELVSRWDVLHAEMNCFSKLLRNGGMSSKGSTMYVTLSPCKDCAKTIFNAGVSRVVYRDAYRDTSGVDYLRGHGIIVEQVTVPPI